MLTHARVFVENILQKVTNIEKLLNEPWMNLKDRIDLLNEMNNQEHMFRFRDL